METKKTNTTGKYQIIARYNSDGDRYFMIGRKINPELGLDDDNVEWKKENGVPLKLSEYSDAVRACK